MAPKTSPILPGSTIAILGGGQLGRMLSMAARTLGYHVRALDPDPSCASRFVVDHCITGSFDDADAARELARGADVVTLEIEKVSLQSMRAAGELAPVRPGPKLLGIIQDRVKQKQWLSKRGFPVGPYSIARCAGDIARAVSASRAPAFVKASHGGYDGRGQSLVATADMAQAAWDELRCDAAVVEHALALKQEVSILVARRPSGEIAIFPPSQNHHEDRILVYSVMPAPIPKRLARQAEEIARELAELVCLEGLLVVEFFVTRSGELLVNELAPRPHNTFHGTEVGCVTSQFEQAVRAICDLPLGSTEATRPVAIYNLLGELWSDGQAPAFDRALALRGVRVHLYGKREARAGRKMGHLTALGKTPALAIQLAMRAKRALETPEPGRQRK